MTPRFATTSSETSTTPADTSSRAPSRMRASQLKYGVKFMEINLALGDPIDTNAEMDTMLNAAVSDLGSPLTTQEMETYFYWPAQLGDLYTFVQNGDHYDSDQKLAVVGYTHKYANGKAITTLQCRGSVVGSYHAWFRRGIGEPEVPVEIDLPTIIDVSVGFPAGTATVEVLARGTTPVGSYRIALSTVSQPSAATIRAAPVYTGQSVDVLITQTVYSGQRLYVGVFAYSSPTGTGSESAQLDASLVRDGTGGNVQPQCAVFDTASDETTVTLTIDGRWSPGAPPPYEYRYRISTAAGAGTFTGWLTAPALPQSLGAIARLPKISKFVELNVRQNSDDATIAKDVFIITPSIPMATVNGVLDRAVPASDGNYTVKGTSTDPSGETINTLGKDTRASLLTTHGRMNSDSLDNWLDTTNYKKPTPLQVIYADRAGAGLDSSSKLTTGLASGPTVQQLAVAKVGSVFAETWDQLPTAATGWNVGTLGNVAPALSLLSDTINTTMGKNVLVVTNGAQLAFTHDIPFNPNKLYRFRCRVRCSNYNTTGAANSTWYLGLLAFLYDGTAANSNSGANYVMAINDDPVASVGFNAYKEYIGWVKGATVAFGTNGAFAGSSPTSPQPLNVGTVMIRPYILAGYPGGGAPGNSGTFVIDYFIIEEYDEDGSVRTYSALRNDGSAQATLKQFDGTYIKAFARGGVTGQCHHNTPLTFALAQQFQSVPAIIFGGGGVLFEPGSKWGTSAQVDAGTAGTAYASARTYDDSHALNPTRTGFTPRLRLRQKNTQTQQTAGFPAANAVASVGADTGNAVVASAPASDDTYIVTFNVSVTAAGRPTSDNTATLLLAIDTDPLGTGAWTESATLSYDSYSSAGSGSVTTTYTDEQQPITLSGFNTSGRFRIRAKSFTRTNPTAAVGSFSIHGHETGDTIKGVTYNTSAGDIYASRTPDGPDSVEYTCVELAY
jgi:hypothetical protein